MTVAVQNRPRWLQELSCESSVLSSSDLDLVMKVQSTIQKQFKVKASYVNNGKKSKQLSYLEGTLQKLIKQQKTYSDSAQYFQAYYPKWRQFRDKNIKILREIANSIQENKENCDGVRLAGSLASLIGGGASLAADHKDSFAAQFGRGITLLGSVFAAGSTLVEEYLLDKKIEEAKATVKNDRYYFDRMWSCRVDSREQVASIKEIFKEIETDRHEWENLWKVVESFLPVIRENAHEQLSMEKEKEVDGSIYQWKNIWKVVESFLFFSSEKTCQTALEMSVQEMLNYINLPPEFQEEICDFVSVIMAISMVWMRHRPLFELASNVFKIKTQFENFTGGLLRILNVWSQFGNGSSSGKSVIVAGMLMDLVNIVNTCEEVSNRSQRKESVNIRKIANILEVEAKDLNRMYYLFLQHDGLMDP